jgi:hypothetical protein
MVMSIGTTKKSGGPTPRLISRGSVPPGILLRQHRTPPGSGDPVVNRMVRIQLLQAT